MSSKQWTITCFNHWVEVVVGNPPDFFPHQFIIPVDTQFACKHQIVLISLRYQDAFDSMG